MSDENTTGSELDTITAADLAALIPASPDAMLAPVHVESNAPEKKFLTVPFVGFRGKKSEKGVEALDAAGIGVDEFYLKHVEPIKLKPFALHVIQYARFYTQQDEDGKITGVSTYTNDDLYEDGYREKIEAVVAVVLSPGNYMPATLSLRSGHVQALKDAFDLLGTPKNPGVATKVEAWAARSAKHKAASAVEFPGGRFRLEIWSTQETPAGGGKNKYNLGHGRTYPTPEAEVAALNAWRKEQWTAIQTVMTVYNARVEKLRRAAARYEVKQSGDPVPF